MKWTQISQNGIIMNRTNNGVSFLICGQIMDSHDINKCACLKLKCVHENERRRVRQVRMYCAYEKGIRHRRGIVGSLFTIMESGFT